MSDEANVKNVLDEIKDMLKDEKDKKASIPEISDANVQDLMTGLNCDKTRDKIGIEFECGECCKKVLNGSKLFLINKFVVLLPAPGDCLFLKMFGGGKLLDKQIMRAIAIPFNNLCAIEIQPVQIDP